MRVPRADGGEGEQPARHQPPQVLPGGGAGGAAAAGRAGAAGPVQVPQHPPGLQREGAPSRCLGLPGTLGSPSALPDHKDPIVTLGRTVIKPPVMRGCLNFPQTLALQRLFVMTGGLP